LLIMPRHLTSGRGRVACGLLAALAGLAVFARIAAAQSQEDCFPPKDSHEAHLFADLAVPLAFSTAEAPSQMAPGAVRLGVEATYLPNIDAETRTPTICRPGKGPEHTDLLFAVPRPRVAVGLPAGFVLEGSWVPPVRLNGVKADLLGVSLERSIPLGRAGSLLALRAHAAFGLIQAPVTCNDAALQDPNSECFQGTRSDDRYHPNTFGAEGVVSWPIDGGRFRPFLGGGLNVLHPRFQVNFTNQFGFTDNRKVEVDLTRGAILAGATWAAVRGLAVTGEIYSSPSDAVTGRLVGSYAIRTGR
jgi:hypothetical protein